MKMDPFQDSRATRSFWNLCRLCVAGLAAIASATTATAAIGTWSQDTGFPGTGVTVSGAGSSPVWTNTNASAGTGNAAIVAPVTPITLTLGQTITFSGNINFGSDGALGNIQFRIGLFDTNTPAVSTSYLGYMAEIPQGVAGVMVGVSANGTNWEANSGGSLLSLTTNSSRGTSTTPNGSTESPFAFTLSVTDNGSNNNTVSILFTSADGTSYNWQGVATDTGSAAAANTTYNEVGFFFPGNAPGNSIAFSNLSVVPEPSSVGLVIAAAGIVAALRRRRR